MQRQKNIDIAQEPMEVETKEEPLEWNGENLCLQLAPSIKHSCGLRNLGNTCYMNSVVQALANVRPLAAFLLSDWATVTSPGSGVLPRSDSTKARRRFCKDLSDTVKTLWLGKYRDFVARPLMTAIIEVVPEFRAHGQQDAEEALTYALNNLHDELYVQVPKELHPAFQVLVKLEKERKRLEQEAKTRGVLKEEEDEAIRQKKEEEARISQMYEPYKRSIVSDTFQSLLAQRVTCLKCETTSLTVQECFNLPLELPTRAQTKTLVTPNGNGESNGRPLAGGKTNGSGVLQKSPGSSSSMEQGSPKVPSPGSSINLARDTDANGGFLSSAFSSLKNAWPFTGHQLELEQCLRSFFSSETLKGEEQYYCEHCKSKEDAVKTHELVHLPEVLCLQLKRFNKSRGTFGLGSAKNSTSVRFPVEELDLAPFCGEFCCESGSGSIYDLIGVVRHSGGANSGHYIATCKSLVQGKWYEFDDEFVSAVTNADQLQTSDAYLLFYSKRPVQAELDTHDKALKTLRSGKETSASQVFISRYWALKFETMSQPGPVDNWSFTCEHGGVAMPALEDVRERVISVSAGALTGLERLFHGSFPSKAVETLEPCEICKEVFEAMEARRLAELEECSELFKKAADVYYIIPRTWSQKWLSFVNNDCGPLGRGSWHGVSPPAEMDNTTFLEKDGKGLKPNLKVDVHYLAVNRFVFKFWEKAYGVKGPILVRASRDIYSATVPDTDIPDNGLEVESNGHAPDQ